MTTNRITTLLAVAGMAALPTLASASDYQTALDSCAKALVANMATKTEKQLKLRETSDADGAFTANRYEFLLVARRASDNAPIARAVCRTDQEDKVVELEEQPMKVTDF